MSLSVDTNTSTSTVVDRGGDGRNELSLTDKSTQSVWRAEAIRSFGALIDMLPGLEQEDGTYYISEPLLASNLREFSSAAGRVEDLTLTDAENNGQSYRKISSDTVIRLAVQGARTGGFFPSLKHLRLVEADLVLDFLWLCLTPSIRTLEIKGLKQNRQAIVSTFMRELTLESPQLESIILEPCLVTVKILSTFVYLRHLELCHFSQSLDFTDFQAISLLPYLEAFIIETSGADYAPCDSFETLPRGLYTTSSFPKLVYLTIHSDVLLICDLIFHLLPKGVNELSLTLLHDRSIAYPLKWLTFNMPHWSNTFKMALSSNPRISATLTSSVKEVPEVEVPFHIFITEKGHKRICHGEHEPNDDYICNDCLPLKCKLVAKKEEEWFKEHDVAVLCFSSVLNEISTMAVHVSVLRISCRQTMANGTRIVSPVALPHNTLLRLLYCPTFDILEIEKWTLNSVTSVFDKLSALPKRQLNFEAIHLPLDSFFNPGIELTTLSLISQLYPRLLFFQSRFIVSADRVCDLDIVDKTGALCPLHGLKELQVSGTLPRAVGKEFEIASYIYFIFPDLEKIYGPRKSKKSPNVWETVNKVLKMCHRIQNVRRPESQN